MKSQAGYVNWKSEKFIAVTKTYRWIAELAPSRCQSFGFAIRGLRPTAYTVVEPKVDWMLHRFGAIGIYMSNPAELMLRTGWAEVGEWPLRCPNEPLAVPGAFAPLLLRGPPGPRRTPRFSA